MAGDGNDFGHFFSVRKMREPPLLGGSFSSQRPWTGSVPGLPDLLQIDLRTEWKTQYVVLHKSPIGRTIGLNGKPDGGRIHSLDPPLAPIAEPEALALDERYQEHCYRCAQTEFWNEYVHIFRRAKWYRLIECLCNRSVSVDPDHIARMCWC